MSAFFLLAAQPAAAQRWQLDIGGNAVKFDTSGLVAAVSFSPFIEWNQPALFARFGGAFAMFEGGQSALQGRTDLSLLTAPGGAASPLRTEALASVDGSMHSAGYRTAALRGEFRVHVAGQAAGLWAGLAGAGGWTSSSAGTASSLGPSFGIWARRRAWNLTIMGTPFRHEGYWFPEAQGHVSTSMGMIDLVGYLGWRGSPRASGLSNLAWGGGTLAFWFTSHSALVLSAGAYPSDLLQALPKGKFLSASIRFSRRRPSTLGTPASGYSLYAQSRGESELRFAVAGASRVELVGDWTGWRPVPLKRVSDGRWTLRVNLAPGVHRFNLVVDGERWIVPEGSAAVDDGFGGKTSLLVVP
jgi:hypothetical protein